MKCTECYDTGCKCGGIGLDCHGCCPCEAGERARKLSSEAYDEIARAIYYINHEYTIQKQFVDEAGHYNMEAHVNALPCDHPNDFAPDVP